MIRPSMLSMKSEYASSSDSGQPPASLLHSYDRVLGSLHSLPFEVDGNDLGAILRDIFSLTGVGEYLGCIDVIKERLNLALLNQNQALYRAIAAKPHAWVDLGMRIKSEVVFRESIVHLVGQWNSIGPEQKYSDNFLPIVVRKLCERKHSELNVLKAKAEHQIVKYYPATLTRSEAESTSYNRQSYSSDIFGWIAITLFKHWFSAALASDKGRHAEDGGFGLYKAIAAGQDGYLSSREVNSFHQRVPMTVKGKSVFEKWLDEIKNEVRSIVTPLLDNQSSLSLKDEENQTKHLTCCKVAREDMPWVGLSRKRKREANDVDEEDNAKSGKRTVEEDEYESDDFGGN